jgi:hypothetical protein
MTRLRLPFRTLRHRVAALADDDLTLAVLVAGKPRAPAMVRLYLT